MTTSSENDPLLSTFLQTPDEEAAREILGDVLARHASPLVRRILGRRLGSFGGASQAEQDFDDLHATALLRLTAQCWALRRADAAAPIASFSSYVATTAENTCHEWLRARAPRRARLQNRIRYVLTRDDRLALWEVADREWWCGLRHGASRSHPCPADVVARAVATHAASLAAPASTNGLAGLVRTVLVALDAPCRFGDFVSALAVTLGETDAIGRRGGDRESAAGDLPEDVPDRGALPPQALENRDYLTRLWMEIVLLPLRQRAALLFNLRDEHGGGMLALLPITGIASMADIARALDVSDEQLAGLWSTLPRDDQWIAEYLGITRRQVINLRKSARERLARRMRAQEAIVPRREQTEVPG